MEKEELALAMLEDLVIRELIVVDLVETQTTDLLHHVILTLTIIIHQILELLLLESQVKEEILAKQIT